MRVRCVILASVSSAFLAASVAVAGTAFAAQGNQNSQITEAAKAMAAGDKDLAIANYTVAIDSGSLSGEDLGSALLNRALAYQQSGDVEKAVSDYDRALKQSGLTSDQAATAHYNRGLAQHKLGKLSAAIDDYTAALYSKPDLAQAYYSRGNALRESGQNLFALSDFEKAIRHNHPDPARVYFAESQAYETLKRPTDARHALDQSVAANPSFEPARSKIALLSGQPKPVVAVAADPLLTASAAPVGGEVTIKKPDLPKAVEPPAELAANDAAEVSAPTTAVVASKPAVQAQKTAVVEAAVLKSKKKYQDRIPAFDAVATVGTPTEKIVAVEPVDATASIEPAAAPPSDTVEEPSGNSPAKAWSVQIASAASEEAAWSTFKKMQAKKKVLRGQEPLVIKADLGAKGTFYRVRFGFDGQAEAQKACSKLKAGGVSCYVSRGNS